MGAPSRTDKLPRALPHQRIGWVLSGDCQLASSRLQGYRIHDYLLDQGLASEIAAVNTGQMKNAYSLEFFRLLARLLHARYHAVVFQKPEWMMFKLSEMLRVNGVRTAAIQCDPFPGDYAAYFDRVAVTSHRLRLALGLTDARIIDDMLEVPRTLYKQDYAAAGDRLRLVWVGQGMVGYTREFFARLVEHPRLAGRLEIITIGRGDWVTRPWSMDSVYRDILDGDVAVIPLPESEWASTKSTNRLTQFMALGMPTVASPIDSYLRIHQHGAPFQLARDLDEFAQAIDALGAEARRRELGRAARDYAWSHYAPEAIGPLWRAEMEQLCALPPGKRDIKPHTQIMGRLMGAWRMLPGVPARPLGNNHGRGIESGNATCR